MRRQRNMFQAKDKVKLQKKQNPNDIEISNLLDKKFKVMDKKMLSNSGEKWRKIELQ